MTNYRYLVKGIATSQMRRWHMLRTGKIAKWELWTKKDDVVVRRLYPDFRALQKALPNRTMVALRMHARKLGLKSKPHRFWSHQEEKRLRSLFTTLPIRELEAEFPDRNRSQIYQHGYGMKLRRPRRYKTTRNKILDEIRRRAARNNVTMRDLDREAGRRNRFFENAMSRRHIANFNVICRAVEYLGGELKIVWHDRD